MTQANQAPPLHEVARNVVVSETFIDQPQRLTRRNRYVLLDFEIFNNHATTWFVRRGHRGAPVDEVFDFERANGVWRPTGGGGAEPGADLTKRPTIADIARDNNVLGNDWFGFPDFSERCDFARSDGASYGLKRPVSFRMQLANEVTELHFSDRPSRVVAKHGYAVLMFDPKRPPTMSAVDGAGDLVGETAFLRQSRLPWRR